MSRRVGLVGARGHTGAELIRLIAAHPGLELDFTSSRELAGQAQAVEDAGVEAKLTKLRSVLQEQGFFDGIAC